MASSSLLRSEKIVFQGNDCIIFEVDEVVANQSMTIKHMIEDSLASKGLILLPKVTGNILAKVIEYYKLVVTQSPAGENNIDLKAFVSALVNDHEEKLFGLLVDVDYLDIKGLLSVVCKDILDLIKCKNLKHIRRIFNIMPDFSLKEEEKM